MRVGERGTLSRRQFLARAASLGAAVGSAAIANTGVAAAVRRGRGGLTAGPWLAIPPTMSGRGARLTAADASGRPPAPGRFAGWAYNDSIPGPTLEVRRGELFRATVRNALTRPTTVHWHGLTVPDTMDGGPMRLIAPEEAFTYEFPIVQRAGLSWYHPHPHGETADQAARGLAGLLIVRDAEEDALGLPRGAYELPLVLRDALDEGDGLLGHRRRRGGYAGDVPLVNGTVRPATPVESTHYRLRLLNASTGRFFELGMPDAHPAWLVGNDGGLLPAATRVDAITLAPAERVDVVLDLSGAAAGERITLRCRAADWDLLTLVVGPAERRQGAAPPSPWVPPARLSRVGPLIAPPGVVHRTFDFSGDRINRREFDMGRVDFAVPLGTTERWRLVAGRRAPHPVHIHGTQFQVESRTGGRGRVFPWERGWKDTVLVGDDETVDLLIRFDHYAGLYMMHCHRLEHEDAGMMLAFAVR